MHNFPKIGVIFAIHRFSEEEIRNCLSSWRSISCRYNIVPTVVSYTFAEQRTQKIINENLDTIKFLINEPFFSFKFLEGYHDADDKNLEESSVRDKALQYLKSQNVDLVFIWDADEIATEPQLENIIKYVIKYSDYLWYSISYKNFVFDKETFLAEPFTPPRIFWTKKFGNIINRFYLDNDISYISKEGKEIRFNSPNIPYKIIPANIAWINHYSWLSDKRSKEKIEYQNAHFKKYGGECSFSWDKKNDKLIFNLDYFEKRGLMLPKINKI